MAGGTLVAVLLALVAQLALGQAVITEKPSQASGYNGTWKATFADSVFSGTVYMTFVVGADGTVLGTYKATTDGRF